MYCFCVVNSVLHCAFYGVYLKRNISVIIGKELSMHRMLWYTTRKKKDKPINVHCSEFLICDWDRKYVGHVLCTIYLSRCKCQCKKKNGQVLEFCFNLDLLGWKWLFFCSWYLMQDSKERSPAYQQLLSRLKCFPVFSRLPSQASSRIQTTGKTAFWNVQWVILKLLFFLHTYSTLIGQIVILVAWNLSVFNLFSFYKENWLLNNFSTNIQMFINL
jgi:hypothetical protein